jgi:hypothetical protein
VIVVSNTTPLIGLASIERFDLLRRIFGELIIAQAVYAEAVVAGREVGGALCQTPQYWLNLQAAYDLKTAEAAISERLEAVSKLAPA